MPTGFIPSQDSGFFFGVMLGPQDISFESMAQPPPRHRRNRARQPRRSGRGRVRDAAATRRSSSRKMKPRDQRTLSVDQIIEAAAAQGLMAVPGVFTFMQNPPPITVSGQNSDQRLPAHPAKRQPGRDLHLGAAADGQDAADPRASWTSTPTCRFPSPQVMVDIDRDRALGAGRHAAAGAGRALQRLRPRARSR